MIFYDCSTAPNPRRARMFIAEKGLEVETHEIPIADGVQLEDEFLAINPRGTVPVLVTDDGLVLTENAGIAAYLEAAYPDPPLMGTTPREKGLALMWNAIVETQGGQAVSDAFRNAHRSMAGRAVTGPRSFQQIPELAERGKARAEAFLDILEERLTESPYLAGNAFMLPDITAYAILNFARVIRLRVPEGNSATLDWLARVSERPSAKL